MSERAKDRPEAQQGAPGEAGSAEAHGGAGAGDAQSGGSGGDGGGDGVEAPARIVPPGLPDRGAEYVVLALLALAMLFAVGFIVVYAEYSPAEVPNQLLGVCIGGALGFAALALAVLARRLVVTEELEDDYPQENPREQSEIAQLVHESASRITRRRLLLGAGAATGGVLGLAGLTPVLSLGPLWDTAPLDYSPWRRGRRLVDPHGYPMLASEVEEETFYTAFAEGADREDIASVLVVVRLHPSELRLPKGREGWAPYGILAYSKICTHAGCAVALYRKPRFPVVEAKPALVCPCHYSTFNPATGASVIFGPAGRPLPQLPLMIDPSGHLRAAGDFSGRVGPAWWGVREGPPT
ncbi:MAG TPA: ubiquinol-cytochrome c reductase iron-sulfur subunit [Solirubrobacteraceae bacterium]|nr:ubiquinol-cytochrome c reductase iron-sulfur subunit [Solirubrobacteraceae bacterium]